MSNASVCQHYIDRAREALDEWDGVSTAELVLDICRRTGESVTEVLEEAEHKHRLAETVYGSKPPTIQE